MATRPLSVTIPFTTFSPVRPTLDEVLSNTAPHPYTLSAFMAYLSQNHCLETLEFTMEAKRYGESYRSVSRMLEESPVITDCLQSRHLRMLWDRLLGAYIIPDSPREINLPGEVRDSLIAEATSHRAPTPDRLDPAVQRMHDLMEESIFMHFLNSHTSTGNFTPAAGRSPYLDADESRSWTNTSTDDIASQSTSPQEPGISPQSSMIDFASHRPSHAQGRSSRGRSGILMKIGPRGSSGDLTSTGYSDDLGSMDSSSQAGDLMTPPTTPPSSDLSISPRTRSEKTFKKMTLKLGFKKKQGNGGSSRDQRSPTRDAF
jgi:hypothetical protein